MQYHNNLDRVLVKTPATRHKLPASVTLYQDQQQVSTEGNPDCALDVNVPQIIGCSCDNAADRLDRWNTGQRMCYHNRTS